MNIQDLRIFGRVADVLNITSVGNEFQLSPGTVSKKLQMLENELGVQLFERTTRSIRITPEGKNFLVHARKVVASAEDAVAAIDNSGGRVRGKLKVSTPKAIGQLSIASCIASFLEDHPEIEMQVDFSSRLVNLQEEGYDVAIRTGALADSSLVAKRVGSDPLVIAAAPGYLEANPTPRRPKDLEKHSCLVIGDQWHWTFQRKSATQTIKADGRLRGNDASLLVCCALRGCGIIRVSRSMIDDDLQAGRLIELLREYDTSKDCGIWAVYAKKSHVPPRLRAFVDYVTEWLRTHGPSGAEARLDRPDALHRTKIRQDENESRKQERPSM